MTSFVETNEINIKKCYYIYTRRVIIINYTLCDDLIDQMVEELSYIKLKTAIELGKKR